MTAIASVINLIPVNQNIWNKLVQKFSGSPKCLRRTHINNLWHILNISHRLILVKQTFHGKLVPIPSSGKGIGLIKWCQFLCKRSAYKRPSLFNEIVKMVWVENVNSFKFGRHWSRLWQQISWRKSAGWINLIWVDSKGFWRWCITLRRCRCLPHLRKETDPVSETLCSLVFRLLDDGQSHETL
jgi:hypothetical protein